MEDSNLNSQFFSTTDFNPDKFVRELSQSCVGGQELHRLRNKIYLLSEETSGSLKKNVYHNYMQFIDTAKEISHLESEMYQLSHLLTEQRTLLGALSNTVILAEEMGKPAEKETDQSKENDAEAEEEARRHKLTEILEKVEGCIGLLDTAGRTLLYEGDLLELDALDSTPLQRMHGYLFSDGFMLASWNANRRGPMRYKFQNLYDLGSLAVVNVRDLGTIKWAFKLLAFPDTRVFQCTSNTTKKEWLEKCDQAKRSRLAQDQIKRESTVTEKSPSRTISIDSPTSTINPFDEVEEESVLHPEWMLDVAEELDVFVAQRHFEEALSLLERANEYIHQHINSNNGNLDHLLQDIQRKVTQRHKNLTEVLMRELEVNPDKSLQGGLRAARRAVRLLNKLDRATQACDLFLQLCSSIMKAQCKRVKREGSTIVYVKNLCAVVFTNLCHMTEEYLRAFPNSPNCASAFIVWAGNELNLFSTHFIKQVFVPQTTLATLTECVDLVRTQCEKLTDYGVDLCYQLDGMLRKPLTRALNDAKLKLIDSGKVRALEDKWIPMNLKTKNGLARFLQEHADMGIVLDSYVTGDCWIQLTANTISFIKLYLALLGDSLKLSTPELIYPINETLYEVMQAQLKYQEQSFKNETKSDTRQFIVQNATFLLNVLLPIVQKKFKDAHGFQCTKLEKLPKEFDALLKGHQKSAKHITKYSSNEYL